MFIKRHPSANTNSKTQLNQFSTSLERQNSVESVHPSDEDDSEDEFDEDLVADAEGLDGSRNVSLDNGYKPVMITNETSSSSDTESVESDDSSESDSEDEIENQKSKLWCFIALTISILRCALFLFCLGACFVIFVIFTHEDSSGFKEHPPAIEFCPSKQNEPSSNVIEVESESPTEPLDGLDEALMTSTEEASSNEDANNDKIDSGEKATTNSIEEENTRYVVKAVPMSKSTSKVQEDDKSNSDESTPKSASPESETKDHVLQDKSDATDEKDNTSDDTTPNVNVSDELLNNTVTASTDSIESEGSSDETSTGGKGANKTEADIPSFREWTKKALEEEQKKKNEEKRKREEDQKFKQTKHQNLMNNAEGQVENKTLETSVHLNTPHKMPLARMKKNFASQDCGAKVVSANAEAQSATNVITPSRDEYMLNKCTDQAWFVVELCENIKAFKIEIANFELYSSVPKEFRVSMSNVLSANRESDWRLFGEFQLEDSKEVQTFTTPDDGVFGKYVKVEILSHHGNEHYCPVSLFKIYGISEMELIDDDDTLENPDSDDVPETSETVSKEEGHVNSTHNFQDAFENKDGIFGIGDQIKDFDLDQALKPESLTGNTFAYNISCLECDSVQLRKVYFLLAFDYGQLLKTLENHSGLKSTLSNHVCESNGFKISHATTAFTSSAHHLTDLFSMFFGSSRVLALCNVIGVENGHQELVNGNREIPIQDQQGSQNVHSHDKQDVPANGKEAGQESLAIHGNKEESETKDRSKNQMKGSSKVATASEIVPPMSKRGEQDRIDVQKKQGDHSENVTLTSTISPSKTQDSNQIKPTPVTNQNANGNSQPTQTDNPSTKPLDPPLKDPPDVVFVPPSTEKPTKNNNGNEGGVWQKLANKIKALERNVSLSGAYLEELSVQYKKQIEELQKEVHKGEEALVAASKERERDRANQRLLHDQIGQLKIVVEEVSTRMETMSTWAIGVHALFLMVEIFIGILFVFACVNLRSPRPISSIGLKTPKDEQHPVSSTPLKRRHSHEEKSVCLSDHHIQEIKISKRRRSLDLNVKKSPQILSGKFAGSVEGLSKKQKKRMLRRLSKQMDDKIVKIPELQTIQDQQSSRTNSESSEWQTVRRTSNSGIVAGLSPDTTPNAAIVLVNGDNNHQPKEIELENMFSMLNHSQHEDETPLHSKPYFSSSIPNMVMAKSKKMMLTNGNHLLFSDSSATTSRSVTPISENSSPFKVASRHLSKKIAATTAGGKLTKKRSKSTSPLRKSESTVSKQKDMMKHFDPGRVDWIQRKQS